MSQTTNVNSEFRTLSRIHQFSCASTTMYFTKDAMTVGSVVRLNVKNSKAVNLIPFTVSCTDIFNCSSASVLTC